MYQIILNNQIYEGKLVEYNKQLVFETAEGETICDASKIIPGLLPGEYAIKNYSENLGLYEQLVELQLIQPAHRYVQQQFVTFPICKLNN